MSADSERDRGHRAAVLGPALKVWMTMTGLKAAQAVAMMAGPKLVVATDLAEVSCATALERGPSYPTCCKKVDGFRNHIKRQQKKHQRPKTPIQQKALTPTKLRPVRGGCASSVSCLYEAVPPSFRPSSR